MWIGVWVSRCVTPRGGACFRIRASAREAREGPGHDRRGRWSVLRGVRSTVSPVAQFGSTSVSWKATRPSAHGQSGFDGIVRRTLRSHQPLPSREHSSHSSPTSQRRYRTARPRKPCWTLQRVSDGTRDRSAHVVVSDLSRGGSVARRKSIGCGPAPESARSPAGRSPAGGSAPREPDRG